MRTTKVSVVIDDNVAVVTPAMESLLALILSLDSNKFKVGGPRGYTRTQELVKCYRLADGCLNILPGLAEFVAEHLRQTGYEVDVQDRRQAGRSLITERRLREAAEGDRSFLEIIAREPRGVIEARNDNEMARTIARICWLYPQARVLIPVTTNARIDAIYGLLHEILGNSVSTIEQWCSPCDGGQLVCSLQLFDSLNDYDWNVVIIPEALNVAPRHWQTILDLGRQRVYGITDLRGSISVRQWLRAQLLFGPIIRQPVAPTNVPASVRIRWCQTPWSPAVPDCEPLERKRRGYWHNTVRNDAIAAMAKAFCTGDAAELGSYLLRSGSDDSSYRKQESVTILVESTEHGRELLRRLPGWFLIHAAPGSNDNEAWQRRNPLLVPWLHQVIITHTQVSQQGSLDTDVLIRADGSEWPLTLARIPPRGGGDRGEITLVDLTDDFDRHAKEATQRRLAEYVARNWASGRVPTWLRGVPY